MKSIPSPDKVQEMAVEKLDRELRKGRISKGSHATPSR